MEYSAAKSGSSRLIRRTWAGFLPFSKRAPIIWAIRVDLPLRRTPFSRTASFLFSWRMQRTSRSRGIPVSMRPVAQKRL